jgi:hypothetical protein
MLKVARAAHKARRQLANATSLERRALIEALCVRVVVPEGAAAPLTLELEAGTSEP